MLITFKKVGYDNHHCKTKKNEKMVDNETINSRVAVVQIKSTNIYI